jgi:signal transduction histidine kinase
VIGAAGAVLPAVLAVALAVRARRRLLNEALHELRRPLQELALRGVADGTASAWITQAGAALAELDSLINGRGRMTRTSERFSAGELLGSCKERWAESRPIRFELTDPNVPLLGDRHGIGAALDNLIANAVEHGRGPVLVRGSRNNGSLTLSVSNQRKRGQLRSARPDARRGRGLRIAEQIAVEQGGRLEPRLHSGDLVVARLVLPVAASANGARGL